MTRATCLLASFRYSPEKREIIIVACEAEAKAQAAVQKSDKRIFDALVWAGLGKSRARSLLPEIEIGVNPYQPLFVGLLPFKTADRFARRIDPDAAERSRPPAILIAAFRALAEEGHTIADASDLFKRANLDFALSRERALAALEILTRENVITPAGKNGFGLASLINAERRVAAYASAALYAPLSEKARAVVEYVIANAATLLKRPGFALDAEQAGALRSIFEHRLSIVAGPPGSGKTAIVALANIAAATLYPSKPVPGRDPGEERPSCFGVALAGRAASTLADAASVPLDGGDILAFPGQTIHRAFGLDADQDDVADTPRSRKGVECGVFIVDEASMVSAPLLAHVLKKTTAEHVALVGDADQLPPIGPGAPFADLIASRPPGLDPGTAMTATVRAHGAPVTRLKGNYRTDIAGIRELCASILSDDIGAVDGLAPFAELGGVAYIEAPSSQRGVAAGKLWRDLTDQGVSPHEIAVITPRNVGDDGAKALNAAIRAALGFGPALQVGDLLMVTANRYDAPTPDGETVAIYNGERAEVIAKGRDTIDCLFPGSPSRLARTVRLLASGDGGPPEGTAFGYAMTAHKAQGSQFAHVFLITARPDRFVSRSSIYTAASRAREALTVIGDEAELAACAGRAEPRRKTLLSLGKA